MTDIKDSRDDRTPGNISGKEWGLLPGLMLLALLIRLFMLRYEYVLTPDGVYYAILGKNLVSGNWKEGLSTYWPPLYPLLVGFSSLIFQDLEFGGRLVSVLAGMLLVVPVYLLIRDSYGQDVAALGGFLIAVYPSLTHYSTRLLTESTYMLLFISGILVGWSALSRGNRKAFLFTGFAFGASYLVRPEAIGFMGLMIILTLSTRLFHHHLGFKRILFNIFVLILGFAVLAFPYILYLHRETGQWTISEKLVNIAMTHSDGSRTWFGLSDDGQTTLADRVWAGNRSTGDRSENGLGSDSPQRRTSNFLGTMTDSLKVLKYQYESVIPEVFPPLFVLLSGLGLFRATWSKERAAKEVYLLMFFMSTLIGYGMSVSNPRFLLPLIPLFICWTSKGIVEFENWIVGTAENLDQSRTLLFKNRSLIRALLVAIVLLFLLPSMTYPIRGHKLDQPLEQKHAAMWIRDHSRPAPLIMSAGPWAAFYSGGKHLYLPDEEYSVVIEYAKRKKVDYIIIDERWVPQQTPRLKFLLNEESQHPELKLVHKDETSNYKLLIFELM